MASGSVNKSETTASEVTATKKYDTATEKCDTDSKVDKEATSTESGTAVQDSEHKGGDVTFSRIFFPPALPAAVQHVGSVVLPESITPVTSREMRNYCCADDD